MSRIILNGKNRKFRTTCEDCKSIIEYKKKEIKHEYIPKEETTFKISSTEYDYIHCPACKGIIVHDSINEIY